MPRNGTSISNAKYEMRRAVRQLTDPWPKNTQSVWDYFESRCAYCGVDLTPGNGDLDHADPDGGNHLGNLVLACSDCNAKEKRALGWREFLRVKVPGDGYPEREARIEAWIALHPSEVGLVPPEAQRLQDELEAVTVQFGEKCVALRDALKA